MVSSVDKRKQDRLFFLTFTEKEMRIADRKKKHKCLKSINAFTLTKCPVPRYSTSLIFLLTYRITVHTIIIVFGCSKNKVHDKSLNK